MDQVQNIQTSVLKNQENLYWQRFKRWAKVTEKEWNDWHWQYQNLITTPEEFIELFPEFENEVADIRSTLGKYKFTSTPYYMALIDKNNPECPIKLQAEIGRASCRERV